MTLKRRETKVVHIRINYMLIMLTSAQINKLPNNSVPLIIVINLYLDLLSNILGVLHALAHLIIKKTFEENIHNISIL